MVDASKKEFITNLKQLMNFYNNIKEVSKKSDDAKASIFVQNLAEVDDKIAYEFQYGVNPFDLSVLESKQTQVDKARNFLEDQKQAFQDLQHNSSQVVCSGQDMNIQIHSDTKWLDTATNAITESQRYIDLI